MAWEKLDTTKEWFDCWDNDVDESMIMSDFFGSNDETSNISVSSDESLTTDDGLQLFWFL